MSTESQSLLPQEIVNALRSGLQQEYGPVADMPLRMLLLVEQLKEAERHSGLISPQ